MVALATSEEMKNHRVKTDAKKIVLPLIKAKISFLYKMKCFPRPQILFAEMKHFFSLKEEEIKSCLPTSVKWHIRFEHTKTLAYKLL